MSLSGVFKDIFLMITLWGYDLVNPALWGDVGVLKVAPSIIVNTIPGFDWDTPLSIDQMLNWTCLDLPLLLERYASRGFYEMCTMGVMPLVIIGPGQCPMLIGEWLYIYLDACP